MLLQEAQTSSLEAVKKKFALPKYGEVSRIRLEHSTNTPSTAVNSQNSSQITSGGSAHHKSHTASSRAVPQRMSHTASHGYPEPFSSQQLLCPASVAQTNAYNTLGGEDEHMICSQQSQ